MQVRGAASVTAEREARALAALEKSSAERAAALAARERLLHEREEKVVLREVELEALKSNLTRVLSGLDAHREAEQQLLAGHTARLSKEAARLEALQVCRQTYGNQLGLLQRGPCATHCCVILASTYTDKCSAHFETCRCFWCGCVQAALLSEREETKLALVMEKQALEEARTARIKVGWTCTWAQHAHLTTS